MFFGQTRADIPVGCDYVVQLSGGYRGVLINAAEKSKTVPFVSSQISDTLAVRIVRTLAPVCTDEVSLEGELIKNISMFKMLNILSVEDLDLKARWSASKVTKSMAAPVGVSKTGIVMLDLHDKAHGPHGLVAGTTGSGKSEILQTYILSMATLYHPYEAAFVIIDFKGGGMVNQFAQLPDICLPPLRECIEFPPVSKEAVQEQKKEVGFYAWIGVYDDPDHQNQDQYAVNLSAANMIIIGSAQTGKTTILQNVIRSLSEQYTPDEVAIYIIDFASMVLKNFETLNHVGGVVSSSEDEKLKNLFKMLWEEMETRKEKLLSVGVSSFVAYKEAGRTDMKQIVLIIDNLTALKELYFQDDDELLNLCREGITVGISIVIANAQTAGIGYKYLSSFSNRIALFCNDGNEYSAIFEHCNRRLEHLPGRCFAEVDKQILECQAYLPFAGEKEFERAEAIRGYIEKRNGECTEVARKIPLIPPVLSMNYMAQQFGNMMRGHFDLAAGLNYEDVMPYMLRMSSIGVLAVVGREGSGRYNWIKYVADMLELMYPGRSKVYISDGIGKKLASMKEKRNVVRYSMIAEDIVSYLKEIEEELQSRYELLAKGIESDPAEADYMLLIIDNPDAIEQISNSKEALASYKNIIGRYRNMNVGVIISAIENAPIPYSAPEVIKGIRDGRHLMYFGDISELKIYDMPLAVTRKFKKPIETGDGYYIKENECIKLKTPFIAGE